MAKERFTMQTGLSTTGAGKKESSVERAFTSTAMETRIKGNGWTTKDMGEENTGSKTPVITNTDK